MLTFVVCDVHSGCENVGFYIWNIESENINILRALLCDNITDRAGDIFHSFLNINVCSNL